MGARPTFQIGTITTYLNRQGATVHLHRGLPVESVIVAKNSRDTRASARIVVQSRVRDIYLVWPGIPGADKAENFLGIRFPSHPQ